MLWHFGNLQEKLAFCLINCLHYLVDFRHENYILISCYLHLFSGSDLPSCSNITAGESLVECPQEDWTVPGLAAMYMLFSNILLVSLVIAMFR